jgi:hypothetical protein
VSTHYMTSTAQRFPVITAIFLPHKASHNTKTKLFSLHSYCPRQKFKPTHYRLLWVLQYNVLNVEVPSIYWLYQLSLHALIHSILIKTFKHTYSLESIGLWTLSIVRNSKWLENTMFRKMNLLSSSSECRKTLALLGPLEGANLNHRTTHVM